MLVSKNNNYKMNCHVGHASSSDGITWVLDTDNPIFYVTDDDMTWRNARTYTPSVLISPFCDGTACPSCVAQMWFSGVNADDTRAIGYATQPCPLPEPPKPPTDFYGILKKNECASSSDASKYLLETGWQASPSEDVVFYHIYKGKKLIGKVLSGGPLVFVVCLSHHTSHHDLHRYKVAAVNAGMVESRRIRLKMVCGPRREMRLACSFVRDFFTCPMTKESLKTTVIADVTSFFLCTSNISKKAIYDRFHAKGFQSSDVDVYSGSLNTIWRSWNFAQRSSFHPTLSDF